MGVNVPSWAGRIHGWITNWEFWSLPRGALGYALTVEAFAVAAVAMPAPFQPVVAHDWTRMAILAGCVIAHIELTRRVDLLRTTSRSPAPVFNYDSVWCIAAVLALPAVLADIIVVVVFTWSWVRVWCRRRPLYRWVFTCFTVVAATQAAAAVLAFDPHAYPGAPVAPAALGLAVIAAAVRWLVNFGLVSGAIILSTPSVRAGQLLSNIGERVLEIGLFGFGVITAMLLTHYPILLIGMVLGVATTHRVLLVTDLRREARTDVKTGLNNAGRWQQVATDAYQRAVATGDRLGMLMLDLDHFKRVNDTYGHVAGDLVLRAVADAMTSEIRADDTAGRWGGEEFAVLLPGVDPADMVVTAERIRRRVHALIVQPDRGTTIADLTISIGAAHAPDPGIGGVDDLIRAADAALYAAKANGRNQVRRSPATSPDRAGS